MSNKISTSRDTVMIILGIIVGWLSTSVYLTKTYNKSIRDVEAKAVCEYSKYSTSDYILIKGIYCKSSTNSYQKVNKSTDKRKVISK